MRSYGTSLCMCTAVFSVATRADHPVVGVGLQSFDWTDLTDRPDFFGVMSDRADEFALAGFTHVWLPPASQALDLQGYIPNQWYKIVGAQSFKALNLKLVRNGVKPVCDVVLNHRSAEHTTSCNDEYTAFVNPTWNTSAVVSFDMKCGDVGCSAFCYDPCNCGNQDTGQNFFAAPDIDHTNPVVRADIKEFLGWMKTNYNCNGWRFDMVVGYHASFAKEYWQSSGNSFAIGEYFEGIADNIVAWTNASGMMAFDIPLRNTLKQACQTENYALLGEHAGKPPGVSGVDMFAASTYIDNHDTTNSDGPVFDGGFLVQHIVIGYAYILTHPSFPWVFRPHYDSIHRDAIRSLIAIRMKARISAEDSLFISSSAVNLYAVYVGAAAPCEGKLAVKMGTSAWRPCGDGWVLAASGVRWAVWNRPLLILFT